MCVDYLPLMPLSPSPPLVVRLRNWVGDVTLSLPLLQRLSAAGYDLTLLGKGWARELLAGQGWPVHVLEPTARGRVHQMRALRRARSAARKLAGQPARRRTGPQPPYSRLHGRDD